jgi:hypothetical protein
MTDPERPYDPEAAVRRWRVKALGRRPKDFAVRDNLIGSLIRDPRAFEFQQLLREPEPWMVELVRHLPEPKMKQALGLVVLHYLHRRNLASLLHPAEATRPFAEAVELFGRVWHSHGGDLGAIR